jgi:hypothetical protein
VLPSVLAPAAAVAGATAVFGGLAPPAGQMGLQQQQPVAAVGFGSIAAVAVPAADQQQCQQQQQQAAWSLQRPPTQQQPQQAPPAPWQQPQQPQQFMSQAQPQQQQQPAAAAAAAEAAAAQATAAASALRAENAALKQKLAEMQAEERDKQQVGVFGGGGVCVAGRVGLVCLVAAGFCLLPCAPGTNRCCWCCCCCTPPVLRLSQCLRSWRPCGGNGS